VTNFAHTAQDILQTNAHNKHVHHSNRVFFCRELKEKKAYTLWLDNFSKLRALQLPNLEMGAWQSCLWTGRAFRLSRVDVDMTVRHGANNLVLPAMPDDIFELYEATRARFLLVTHTQEDCPMLYNTSLTTLLKVNNVPLKPLPCNVAKAEHKEALLQGHDGLSTCYPEGICTLNIGSNRGLIRLLRDHYDSHCVETKDQRYTSLNVDNNIFDRVLKVNRCVVLVSLSCARPNMKY
jgi:hypothetical protein